MASLPQNNLEKHMKLFQKQLQQASAATVTPNNSKAANEGLKSTGKKFTFKPVNKAPAVVPQRDAPNSSVQRNKPCTSSATKQSSIQGFFNSQQKDLSAEKHGSTDKCRPVAAISPHFSLEQKPIKCTSSSSSKLPIRKKEVSSVPSKAAAPSTEPRTPRAIFSLDDDLDDFDITPLASGKPKSQKEVPKHVQQPQPNQTPVAHHKQPVSSDEDEDVAQEAIRRKRLLRAKCRAILQSDSDESEDGAAAEKKGKQCPSKQPVEAATPVAAEKSTVADTQFPDDEEIDSFFEDWNDGDAVNAIKPPPPSPPHDISDEELFADSDNEHNVLNSTMMDTSEYNMEKAMPPSCSPPVSKEDDEDLNGAEMQKLLNKDDSTYEGKTTEELSSTLKFLKDLHYNAMTQICDILEAKTDFVNGETGLKALLEVCTVLRAKCHKVETIMQQDTSLSQKSDPCSSSATKKPMIPKKDKQKCPIAAKLHSLKDSFSPKPSISAGGLQSRPMPTPVPYPRPSLPPPLSSIKKPVPANPQWTQDVPPSQRIEHVETQFASSAFPQIKDDTSWFDKSYTQSEPNASGWFSGEHKDDGASQQFKGTNFPHSGEMLNLFHTVFGLKKFRHNQLEAINAALLKEDCFVLMPTGGGKSLCYQLPALVTAGVTIVISPLISLIQDQVQKLLSFDVPAAHLSGNSSSSNSYDIYRQLALKEPPIKLLYVTPEKISASGKLLSVFEGLYKRNLIARFVIDEAHCVSDWGHDFRPDYKRLCLLREKFPGVPMMALTATATPRVRVDILQQLKMTNPKWFLQSFNRCNLKYEVREKKGPSVMQEIIELIKSKFKGMSGIVYCLSRNECDTVAKDLKEAGISAIPYHAGMGNSMRHEVQEMWINDKVKVICATIAFGMGIDKPDVRFVIHYSIPKSVEGYYQESGRAGRDGETSWCILYYSYRDLHRLRRMIEKDSTNFQATQIHINNLYRMVHFCENKTDCRRVQMLGYFGEIFNKRLCTKNPKTTCDNCLSNELYEACDVTEDARAIVQCLSDLLGPSRKSNYTLNYLVDIFKGSNINKIQKAGHDKLPLHGKGASYQRSDAERLLRKLVLDGFLREEIVVTQMDHVVCYVNLGNKANQLLQGREKILFHLKRSSKRADQEARNAIVIEDDSEVSQLTDQCYNELIEVSKQIAKERGVHYTNVINVEALRQMSREMPFTEEEMMKIPHITKVIYEKYGTRFLEVTQKFGAQCAVLDCEKVQRNFDQMLDDPCSLAGPSMSGRQTGRKATGKRKSDSKGFPAKRKKSYGGNRKFNWKRAQAAKKRASKAAEASSQWLTTTKVNPSTSRASSGKGRGKAAASKSANTPGLMPLPGKSSGRSFLPAPKVSIL